jgi:hypothetical protein
MRSKLFAVLAGTLVCSAITSSTAISAGGTIATPTRNPISRSISLPGGGRLTRQQYSKYLAALQRQASRKSGVKIQAETATATATAPPLLLPPKALDSAVTTAVEVFDVNQDGRADLITLAARAAPNSSSLRASVYLQSASGLLQTPLSTDISSSDISGSNRMSVMRGASGQTLLLLLVPSGIEVFTISPTGVTSAQPTPVALSTNVNQSLYIKDVNGDGRSDFLAVAAATYDYGAPQTVRTYVQQADSTFIKTFETTVPEMDGVFGDLNKDGITDLVFGASGRGPSNMEAGFDYRLGAADGSYGPLASVRLPETGLFSWRNAYIADVDADGRNDVVVTLDGKGAHVFYQTAPLTFLPSRIAVNDGNNIFHVSIKDMTGDGRPDMVFWIDGYHAFTVAVQDAPRAFAVEGTYDTGQVFFGGFTEETTALADINSDGKADLVELSGGPFAHYNRLGTYPVTDLRISGTAASDTTQTLPILNWRYTVANAGPSAISQGVFLQRLSLGHEYLGADAGCANFSDLVVCAVPPLASGASTSINVRTRSTTTPTVAGAFSTAASVLVDDAVIDTNASNDSLDLRVDVPARPGDPRLPAPEVLLYEGAGDSIIPLSMGSTPSSTPFCAYWYFTDTTATTGLTGMDNATNGSACLGSAPGAPGRILVRIKQDSVSGSDSTFHVDLTTLDSSVRNQGAIRLVDDDGTDPVLTSAGAARFEQTPAIYSSIDTFTANAEPSFAAIGDLNGDGRNDVAVSVQHSSPSYILVWLQQADGKLASSPLRWDAPTSIGSSFAVGDFIGDAHGELLVPTNGGVQVVRIVGSALQSTDLLPIAEARRVALEDMNGDGHHDLVVAGGFEQSVYGPSYWTPNVFIYRGNAQRTFDPVPQGLAMPFGFVVDMAIADFNGDGRKDIAIPGGRNAAFPTASIAFQKSNGTFDPPIGLWPAGPQNLADIALGESVAAGDFNHDGKTDLALGSQLLSASGSSFGSFLPSTWIYSSFRSDDLTPPAQRLRTERENSLAAIDLNQDGRDDLLVDWAAGQGFPSQPIRYYLQDETGQLQAAGQLPVFGSGQLDVGVDKIAVGDFDGDGAQDAVILQQTSLGYVHFMHGQARLPGYSIAPLEEVPSITSGQRARYRVRVTNTSTRRSLEIPVAWTLPSQFSATTLVAARGACYLSGSQGICTLPQLDPGGFVDLMLTGSFTAAGAQQVAVTVGSGSSSRQQVLATSVSVAGGGSGGGSGGGGSSGSGSGGGQMDLATLMALMGISALLARRRLPRAAGRCAGQPT